MSLLVSLTHVQFLRMLILTNNTGIRYSQGFQLSVHYYGAMLVTSFLNKNFQYTVYYATLLRYKQLYKIIINRCLYHVICITLLLNGKDYSLVSIVLPDRSHIAIVLITLLLVTV